MSVSHLRNLILPDVKDLIDNGDWHPLVSLVSLLHPSDSAELLGELGTSPLVELIRRLPYPVNVEFFSKLEEFDQIELLEQVGRTAVIQLVENMPPDDRSALLRQLPPATVDAILPYIAQVERNDIRRLLDYEDDTAGAIMTTEYATVSPDMTVGEALQKLRQVAPERETIYIVYVVGEFNRLKGVVSLRDLVTARPDLHISEIMVENVISTSVHTDQEEVAEAVKKYDFLAMPVLDDQGRLVGIVTHDDIVDILEEEYTEDVHRLGAVEPLDMPYFSTGLWGLVRRRGLWLAVLFLGEMFTGTALRFYEGSLEKAIILMAFVPLIISSGGNSGAQSVALITRALGVGEISLKDWVRVFWRESAMGISLGLLLGTMGFFRALMWNFTYMQAACVSIALIGVVTIGTLLGSMLPLFFERIGLDPAVTSSPFVASIVDVMGIVLYFSVAKLLLGI
ncbi:MAG: magnesium transporter [Planctomycetota bacterium]|jgi:magnesium transporter|nr:magnesium transporter [Planctomycetota bacterium]MDP7248251.1 magnesium transporter [Planctomycetota bacterium]